MYDEALCWLCVEKFVIVGHRPMLSVSLTIVSTLEKYGAIHIDFLAKLLNRRVPEILEDLMSLEQRGVIARSGDEVRLTRGGQVTA